MEEDTLDGQHLSFFPKWCRIFVHGINRIHEEIEQIRPPTLSPEICLQELYTILKADGATPKRWLSKRL